MCAQFLTQVNSSNCQEPGNVNDCTLDKDTEKLLSARSTHFFVSEESRTDPQIFDCTAHVLHCYLWVFFNFTQHYNHLVLRIGMCAETDYQCVATARGNNLKPGSSYKTYSLAVASSFNLDFNLVKNKQNKTKNISWNQSYTMKLGPLPLQSKWAQSK